MVAVLGNAVSRAVGRTITTLTTPVARASVNALASTVFRSSHGPAHFSPPVRGFATRRGGKKDAQKALEIKAGLAFLKNRAEEAKDEGTQSFAVFRRSVMLKICNRAINDKNKPAEISHIDKANTEFEQPHIHFCFAGGGKPKKVALKIDGSIHHGKAEDLALISKAGREFLKKHTWGRYWKEPTKDEYETWKRNAAGVEGGDEASAEEVSSEED